MVLPLNDFEKFKELLGFSEGSGNYKAVYKDKTGTPKAFGKYQFIPVRLIDVANFLNVQVPSVDRFLSDPVLQDQFFYSHCLMIYNYIKAKKLDRFIGSTVTGKNKYKVTTTINIYGLIAGSHLAGEHGLKLFLEKNIDRKDALNTYISDYVAKFSDLMSEKKRTIEKLKSLALFGLMLL